MLQVVTLTSFQDAEFSKYKQLPDKSSQLIFAVRLLKQATPERLESREIINRLEAVSAARLGLTITAEWLHSVHCSREPQGGAMRLLDAAAAVCDQQQLKQPREFLFKFINKRFGLDALKTIAQNVEWVLPEEARPRPGQV